MTHSRDCNTLRERMERARSLSDRAGAEWNLHEAELKKLDEKIGRLQTGAEVLAAAVDVLQKYAGLQEREIRDKVEKLVTHGLQVVFEEDLEFCFEFDIKAGQAVAVPKIRSSMGEEVIETTIADARGGGLVDVTSFILRCIMLVLLRPPMKRILLLDEVFKHLSRPHLPKAAALMREMSDTLGIQMILVTHKDEFTGMADNVFELEQKDGVTTIVA